MLFFKAMAIGFLIAAPVGPIGLLCMQRTLQSGLKTGLVTGLGAACADAFFGFIGALGLVALTHWLVSIKLPLSIAGAIFLSWMAIDLLRKTTAADTAFKAQEASLFRAFASTVLLTLTNPLTIFSFLAVYATLMTGIQGSALVGAILVTGIFTGSALWWLTLSGTVAVIRHRISAKVQRAVNYLSGTLLMAFAIFQLGSTLIG
ncbi:LysE family translocator [Reinekea marinisedimentorum]|uniref:Threonine/homoserine/homoserine lactone efflux protein n=1 Tax=Reinekea marinisedimentorum TaxID=230495 RepID=A0A4R3I8X2_9GAMM|nr:LysE family transporter [Reinekea marinisedimentorum]TCS40688.1 threonine/homoserine/homoserine lactone efflux protein [Reinekea marinisedimentorum]